MLNEEDRKAIFKLAADLTGAAPTGELRHESLVANVERRMHIQGIQSLEKYLQFTHINPEEHAELISALSIHTTSWFRENPHFVAFQEHLLSALAKKETFKVWCSACSSGEEVYSFALMLEEFRTIHTGFDYEVLGTDIDPVSVQTSLRAIYSSKNINFHLSRYKHHLLEGSGRTEGYFTLTKAIRDRCKFQVVDLRSPDPVPGNFFHVVVCRNVLIYFDPSTVNLVVGNLVSSLRVAGRLLLGHSEAVAPHQFGLTQQGHSVYVKGGAETQPQAPRKPGKYRVLCVDDSLLTRKYLEKTLGEMGFDTVSVASASEASSYLNFNQVDLITLDLNMPGVSGEKWLQDERREGLKTPVVILSEAHTNEVPAVVRLLALGAQDYIEKSRMAAHPMSIKDSLIELIRATQTPNTQAATGSSLSVPKRRPELVLIGASTGGPQALVKLLTRMPIDSPPIVITQHISPKFAKPLSERLAETAGLKLGNPENNTKLLPGHLYMSFGDYHLGVELAKDELVLRTSDAPAFNGHRPSVDYLFNSALGINRSLVAMLLTGMGRDGALGLRFLHHEGAFCIAQSEEDCIVYGMPREAVERGAVDFVGNIEEIRIMLLNSLQGMGKRTA